jgi:hypothetical protein
MMQTAPAHLRKATVILCLHLGLSAPTVVALSLMVASRLAWMVLRAMSVIVKVHHFLAIREPKADSLRM